MKKTTELALVTVNMEENVASIRSDIKAMAREMKSELSNFQDRIREDLKKELTHIREEIQQKLREVVTDLKSTADRVDKAENRITNMEEWAADFQEVSNQSLQVQESLQVKLTDLEA